MTTKKINSLEDLREKKQMLMLEKDATERLLLNTLGLTRERLVNAVAGGLLPWQRDVERSDLSVINTLTPLSKSPWFTRLLPLVPILWKIIRKIRAR